MHHWINISSNISKISTHHNNLTHMEGVVENSNTEEEGDLTEEELRLHGVTVYNQAIMLDIVKNLQIHAHIAKHMTIM